MTKKVYLKQVDAHHYDVNFEFDWEIIEALREIPSRRYVAETKQNIIRTDDIAVLVDALPAFEFIHQDGEPQISYEINIGNDKFYVNPEPYYAGNQKISRLMYLRRPRDGYELARILKDYGEEVSVTDKLEQSVLSIPRNPELYSFQEKAMEFLRGNSYTGLLSLDMGLGKTIISIQAMKELGKGPVLIVAPASLLYQWKDEIENHFGYDDVKVVTSKTKDREEAFEEGNIIITNYELLRIVDINRHFELLILDECNRVKNWKTQTAKAISKLVAKRVIGLTGTPIESDIMELYNITDQIKPAYFGGQRQFYANHVISNWGKNPTYRNLSVVFDKLQPLMFRKKKSDPDIELDLPALVHKTYEVPLTKREKTGYLEMMAEQEHILGAISNAKVFASSSALRLEDIKVSSKEKELMHVLNEIEGQVVVFTQYKKEVERLKDLIKGPALFPLSGDTPKKERDEEIKKFRECDDAVLLMTEIGTHGLNLQTAKTLINMDLPWTYARLEQRYGRIQRIGSEHESNLLINMVSCDTIDKRIMEVIDRKKALSDMTVDGAKAHVAKAFAEDMAVYGITFSGE